jgi:DNA-binding transcriptional regulator YhcF (GntR family)
MKKSVIVMDKRKGDKEFPSVTACAVALNVSPSTVRNYCKTGEYLETFVGPVRIRYKEAN